jgi:hypothetical protein
MGSILAGVGVGVRKRSGQTGAPAVNFLSGFGAARRSISMVCVYYYISIL